MKMTTETTHYVDYIELEATIKSLYGVTYEVVAAEEASNDSALEFNVDGEIEPYELDDMRKLMSGKWIPFRTGLWLNLMCMNEEIPAGNYIVRISW